MTIIWGFGWLNPPSRKQDSIGWALLHLSLLSSCQDWPNVSTLPTAVTNPGMLGMHATQDARANKSPSRSGRREHVSAAECSLGTSNVAQGQNQDWCGPPLLLVDLADVFLMCQHLYKNTSQTQTWSKKQKMDWPCAILPDALPQHARLGITSICSTASALFTPDEARRSLSPC